MMDKTLRNTFIAVMVPVIVSSIFAWSHTNSRISILEVEVQNDHQTLMDNQGKSDKNMKELMDKINDIQIKVTQLNDNKADK